MRRVLMIVLCLLATQADAQFPFLKKKPPPEPSGAVVINLPPRTYEGDVTYAAKCIYAYEVFIRENDPKKTQRNVLDEQKQKVEKCVRDEADFYGDPAAFRADARQRALARFPPPPAAPTTEPPKQLARATSPKQATRPASPKRTSPQPSPAATAALGAQRDAAQSRPAPAPEISSHIPSPDIVLAAIRGKDDLDTAARKYAAMLIFVDVIQVFGGNRGIADMPPDLAAKHQAYIQAMGSIQGPMEKRFKADGCVGDSCERARFYKAAWGYQLSERYQTNLLAQYLPPKLRYGYSDEKKRIERLYEASLHPKRADANEILGNIVGIIFAVVATAGGAWLFLVIFGRRVQPGPQRPPLTTNFGTARFAEPTPMPKSPTAARTGVMLGKSFAPEFKDAHIQPTLAPIFTTPETHTLIVAPTGTGKGTSVIIPTLLRYGGSILTIDPKGENAAITARARRQQLGHTIHIINPWQELVQEYQKRGLSSSATYNPLDVLDRNDPNVVANAQALAETICPPPKGDRDSFWHGSAAEMLTAIFLWLTEDPTEQKTLGRAREIIGQSRRDLRDRFLVRMAASKAFGGAIGESSNPFIDMADDTYSGVMSNLSNATKFLSDPRIKATTATSSFSMKDLLNGKTTVYVVIPMERMQTQRTWLRLVITSAMQTFKRYRQVSGGSGRCMFLIDEFAALGRIDEIPKDIATMRGYGLDMTLIVQGIEQLKATYGDSEATILNNCAYKWFCNIDDLSTAKYLSECLGKKTVGTINRGFNKGQNRNAQGESVNEGESTNFGEMGRDLLTPDEILNLGKDVAIALQTAGRPLYLQPIDYRNLTKTFQHLQPEYPGLYWEPPLTYDPNPYIPGAGGESAGSGNSGHQKQGGGGGSRGSSEGKMTDEKARAILGVGPKATPDEIRAAYKRLISKIHPDKGGSNYLAQQLNAAKAFLLGE